MPPSALFSAALLITSVPPFLAPLAQALRLHALGAQDPSQRIVIRFTTRQDLIDVELAAIPVIHAARQ